MALRKKSSVFLLISLSLSLSLSLRRFHASERVNVCLMGLLSHRICREELRPGDHIYSWRVAYLYAHHGIYIGSESVIHFTRGQDEETGTGTSLDKLFGSSLPPSRDKTPCQKCGTNNEKSGVVLSCLDCFLCGCPLYRFQYQENTLTFLAKIRGGTGTLANSDPHDIVLHRARYILVNGFGCYNIFHNNCEDFAIYCKTGLLVMEKTAIGRSGQAASILGAPFAAVCSSPLSFLMTQSWGLLAVSAAVYCVSRYAADIGVRKDVIQISVEDLVVRLGSVPNDNMTDSETKNSEAEDYKEKEA